MKVLNMVVQRYGIDESSSAKRAQIPDESKVIDSRISS